MSYITYIEEKIGRIPLHFLDAAYINGYFWVTALEWNGYYRVNAQTGKAEFLGLFENADLLDNKLFNQVLDYKEFVFFIPWFSNYLVKLNTVTLGISYYKLPNSLIPQIAKFRAALIYDKKIFMFPHVCDEICIFDIEKEEFSCDRKWVEEYSKYEILNSRDRFDQGCKIEEFVYLTNYSGSFIMKYNLNNYQYSIISFPEDEKKIVDIVVYDKDKLLLLTWVGNIWCLNIQNGYKTLIYRCNGNVKFPYRHVLVHQDYFLLIPAFEKKIVLVGKFGEERLLFPDDWRLQYLDVDIGCIFNRYYKLENIIMLYPCLGNMLLKIDVEKKVLSGIKISGGNNINLQAYINLIVNKKDGENDHKSRKEKGNMEIWNIVRGIE